MEAREGRRQGEGGGREGGSVVEVVEADRGKLQHSVPPDICLLRNEPGLI